MNFQFNPRQLENHFQLMDLQETKEPDGVVGVKNTGKVIAEDPDVRLHRFIVIGASNSGKTIFAIGMIRRILRELNKEDRKIVAVNVDQSNIPYQVIQWNELPTLHNSALLVDDVLSCKPNQFDLLSAVFNYQNHHSFTNPVCLITHQTCKTGVFGTLSLLHRIYFAAKSSSIIGFRKVMSTFGMDKATMKEYLTKLSEESKKDHNFVYFDLEDSCKLKTDKLSAAEWSEVEALMRDSSLINRDKAQKQKKTEELKSRLFEVLEDYLSCQTTENQKRGKFIFRLIYAKYGDQLNPDDLSLDLGRKKKDDLKGKTVKTKASILNYILTLLEECEPPPDVLELHEYMKRTASIVIPAQYVVNKYMKKIL